MRCRHPRQLPLADGRSAGQDAGQPLGAGQSGGGRGPADQRGQEQRPAHRRQVPMAARDRRRPQEGVHGGPGKMR